MRSTERFSKKTQSSVFGKLIGEGIHDTSKLLNAIEFIEGPNGIGVKLRPVQRVIAKAIFGVPFDFKPAWTQNIEGWGYVPMFDMLRQKLERVVTEEEYLHICYEEGRCNVNDWRDIPERGYTESVIFAGRRGGKSELVAAICSYKLYLLLNIRSPQEYFGLVPGSPIDITFLAQDEKGADRLFRKLREDVGRASFFTPYLKDNNNKALTFVSEADRKKREMTPTLTVWSLPCTTNAVRGPSSVFLALDEFAHFRSARGSTSDDMYAAATPATGDFHHVEKIEHKEDETPKPEEENLGPVKNLVPTTSAELHGYEEEEEEVDEIEVQKELYDELAKAKEMYRHSDDEIEVQDSMILSISSPLKKVGKMYELHRMALDEGPKSSIFTLRCSTAEMNPKLPSNILRNEYKKNQLTFKAEYGGQFLESSESYLSEISIRACTACKWDERGQAIESSARLNKMRFNPRDIGYFYFWGLDLGGVNSTSGGPTDATALAVAHLEYGGPHGGIKLIYDYIDRMICGEVGFWPGVSNEIGGNKYLNYTVLPLEDILAWLNAVNKMLPCFKGATDQHAGQQLIQLLELNEIHNVELVNLTPAINSQMAYALRGYVENQLCEFPYVPKFIRELKLVECEIRSKYMINVAAPLEKGAHDDMADAAQLVAFLAQKWLMEEGHLQLDPTGKSLLIGKQMANSPTVIKNLDSVSLTELKIMEKLRKVQHTMGGLSGGAPISPFHKRTAPGRGRG
jgi:hypothetical protein